MNAGTKKDDIVSSFFMSRQSIARVIELDRLQAVGLCARFGWCANATKPAQGGLCRRELVEPGGFEPPSASAPLSVLHA